MSAVVSSLVRPSAMALTPRARTNRPSFLPQIVRRDLRPHRSHSWFLNGRQGRSGVSPGLVPSASLGTVRRGAGAKALTGFTFGSAADDADGADGLSTPFSGEAWLRVVAAMLMVRVRARPSRSKLISMPICRCGRLLRRSHRAHRRCAQPGRFVRKIGVLPLIDYAAI